MLPLLVVPPPLPPGLPASAAGTSASAKTSETAARAMRAVGDFLVTIETSCSGVTASARVAFGTTYFVIGAKTPAPPSEGDPRSGWPGTARECTETFGRRKGETERSLWLENRVRQA